VPTRSDSNLQKGVKSVADTQASRVNSEINAIRKLNTHHGIYDIHTNQMHYPASMQPTHARIVPILPGERVHDAGSKVFPALDPTVARNFTVHDVVYETPRAGISTYAYEHDDPGDFLAPFRGLGAVSDEIKDMLPAECRVAFEEALKHELEWKAKIHVSEAQDACRRAPVIDKDVVPYGKQQ
jgi:chromatin structure-remodeling complex protein RSC7